MFISYLVAMAKESQRTLKESAWNVFDAGKDILKSTYLVVKSTAKALWSVFVFWRDAAAEWDKAIWKNIKKKKPWKFVWYISDKMLRTLYSLGIAWWLIIWWQQIDFQKFFHKENKWEQIDNNFLWDDPKVFWVDVSRFNEHNVEMFREWAESLDNSKNPDKRRPKFVYIQWRKEKWEDPKAREHYEKLKQHRYNVDKHVAVGSYAYFDKSAEGITDKWIEDQVNDFIQIYNVINQDWDGLIDITPMLDFEFSGKEKTVLASSTQWKKYKEAVLKWLRSFESKTWVIPWIYANASTYHDYFYKDPKFAKYPVWIACYSDDRVDQEKGIVTFQWDQMQAHIIQFSEEIKKSGLGNHKWNVDGNSSTQWEFWKLIQNNSDAPVKNEW